MNLRGNDQNACYIEVIVNDSFVTQVTSVTQFNAIFITQKCRVLRCNSLGMVAFSINYFHFWADAQLLFTKERHFQSSNLKMLQHRGYTETVYVNKETGFSAVMLHYQTFPHFKEDRAEVNWCQNTIVPMSMTYNKPLTERLLSLYHKDYKDLLTVDLFSVYLPSGVDIVICYIEVDFTSGLPDYVHYIKEFVILRFVILRFYSIHFTVTLAGT